MSASEIAKLLERSAPGSSQAVRGHIRRCEALYSWIRERYREVGSPWQIQAKHLRAALEAHSVGVADRTAYDYWRSARTWAGALGRWPDWEPRLRGPWSPDGEGGRPPNLPERRR